MLEKFIISKSPLPAGTRVHDFIKGWGTITKSGIFIRWDSWTQNKKSNKTRKRNVNFDKFTYPVIGAIAPALFASDFLSVQPLTSPTSHGQTFISSGKSPRKISSN